MKRVIFICLLSLSACLSDQSVPQDGKPAVENTANKASVDPKPQTKEVLDASKNLSEVSSNVPTQSENASPAQASPPQGSPPVQNSPTNQTIPAKTNSNTTNSIVTDPKSNATKTEDNKTGDKLPEGKPSEEKTIKPVIDEHKNETSTETASKTGNNTTIIDNKGKTNANATKNEIQKPTEAPALQARGFDGPSFIGGIILTLGLIAISFMGYKYYKNHTERNYYGTL